MYLNRQFEWTKYVVMSFVIVPHKVCDYRLMLVTRQREGSKEVFHDVYGSSSTVAAAMWRDLQATGKLDTKEDMQWGFRSFLMAHHWLWACPKMLG